MKNYLTAGIGLGRLIRLTRKNSISWQPKYLLRFLFLVQSALWSDLFSWIEDKRYGKKIKEAPFPDDPIFIIGHWRTGTTFLHQLLNLDPNLGAPTLFQVAEPGCFICSYRYYVPVFSTLLSKSRPMDNVVLGMNEPQEDEYAIYRLTDSSPIERLVFPKDSTYFILDHPSFIPDNENEKKVWEEQLRNYFRKLSFFHGKRIVSKNPFNSFRIQELAMLFPKARFIHMVRHPYDVVPSTLNMWKIVLHQNTLNGNGSDPCIDDVIKGIDKVLATIQQDSAFLPKERYYEMKFEDLEADPVNELKKLYSYFTMPLEESLGRDLESFLNRHKCYKKNEFQLTKEEKELIQRQLFPYMRIYNYK